MKQRQALRLTVMAISTILAWVSLRTVASDRAPILAPSSAPASEAEAGVLERGFRDTVHPFLATYCVACHGGEKPKGGLDLIAYASLEEVAGNLAQWETIAEQVESETMPPAKAKRHPPAELRGEVVAWVGGLRRREARRNAGDPGPVFARRLSNAEYDHTIRDLTGVDIRPTQEFPVDPANEAGFDNSAESLMMSPALFQKYLETARRVAEHVVLVPQGLVFAPFPVVADSDRDKYCVRRVIDFYGRQQTDYAAYFRAAWRFRNRAALGKPAATLGDLAAEAGGSLRYLATIWSTLEAADGGDGSGTPEEVGPIAALRLLWRELPPAAPDGTEPQSVRAGCERMRDFVVTLRRLLTPIVRNLPFRGTGVGPGSQSHVLWKNRQFVKNRMRYCGGALGLKIAELEPFLGAGSAAAKAMAVPDKADKAAAGRYEAAFPRFCATFPDVFFLSERGRENADPSKTNNKYGGRLLSAGFHSMTGYFRDDGPLYELMLDEAGRRALDRLWEEFDFITGAPIRQYTSYIWFERAESGYLLDPEFDGFRSEDKDVTSPAKIEQLKELYLAKARRQGATAPLIESIEDHYRIIAASIRRVEEGRRAAEPVHVAALQAFAERAYRRPLSGEERDEIAAFYRELRERDGLSHEDAVRDTITRILLSPEFGYRIDQVSASSAAAGSRVRPLSDHALASRLSYFLWASMPDEELRAHADAGDLHREEVLVAQARRLLRDGRVRGLATEFGGNWLDFRRFEEHNSVDRTRFPGFNDALRSAMFEEPLRFFVDLVQNDRSVLDFLEARHTFVNPVLARHYGMPAPETQFGCDDWARVEDARRYGRGGLLPMAVFLTKHAPGLRTSPVKRGYWVVRRLLGEEVPAPPAQVPELPSDEANLGELTLRETLARHRADKSCVRCHERLDPIGLAFEGYGPVGEFRTVDLGGRPVDAHATFPGGGEGTGVDGLRDYLRTRRQHEFVENLCRKLLAYALGRNLLPSDDDTVDDMRRRLEAGGHRFGVLVDAIVASPQFRNKRVKLDGEHAEE